MKTAVGIFLSHEDALEACRRLQSLGFEHENLMLVAPGVSKEKLDAVKTEDAEQPGMGKALGSVVGGAVGLGGGAQLAGAVMNLFVPGLGSVAIITFGAAAAGVGGALAGAAAGGALENALSIGLPKDEIFFYEDALKKGRTLLIAVSEDGGRLDLARSVIEQAGAESLDAAREQWWIGLRDAEQSYYSPPKEALEDAEETFRRGFEAALEKEVRGKSDQEAEEYLNRRHPDLCGRELFRRGFDRGRAYCEQWLKSGAK